MASTSGKNRYPPRLYEAGRAPKQLKSMNHYCFMSNLQMVQEGIGNDAWDAVKNSSVGVIAKFKEVDYTWSALTVHYLLTNQLAIQKRYELWSLVDDQPIRFSLHEFAAITGLNCAAFNLNENWDVDHREIWEEMNFSTAEGPSLKDLQMVLRRCKDWDFEKRRMVGWLAILTVGILGISPNSKIPLQLAKRVIDPVAFESYPWGRVACASLIESVKVASYGVKKTYALHGCVHVLLVWAFDSIHVFGRLYGKKRDGDEVPLLSYAGSRPRVNYEEIIKTEKKSNDNKISVSNLTQLEGEDIEPKWDGDNKDVKVSNLIEDILHNRLDTSAWDVQASQKDKKKRRKASVQQSENEGNAENVAATPMKNKMSDSEKLYRDSCGEKDNTLIDMVKRLTEKVDSMDQNLPKKVKASLEPLIDARVTGLVNEKFESTNEKIAKLEEDVRYLKELLKAGATKEAALSNCNENDDATSKDMSWKVHTKATSQEEFPVRCVIKKEKKPIEATTMLEMKKKTTEQQGATRCLEKGGDYSGETWSDPIFREEVKKSGICLDNLSKFLPKRVPQLAPTQRMPFIGNSTVKRIISGVIPSVAAYDPFELPVEESRMNNLLDYIRRDGERLAWERKAEFYNILIKPREQWPNDTYGWLKASHICDAMIMFHKRAICDPSPYHSTRIAFLDIWFVNSWVRDYADFNPKTWVVPDRYKGVFNGTYPADYVTNKKWIIDVDHLYACHFINDNHWIALDIDLVKERIHVYDSIMSLVKDDKEILNYCRPFTRMIPALLNVMVPSRKTSDKQFSVKRLRNVPQNDNPGDCGVYALKYIECLAIGCTFEGLCDKNIAQIRCKLAVDILEAEENLDPICSTHLLRRKDLTEELMLQDS